MTDIVERLRVYGTGSPDSLLLMREAADKIELLRKALREYGAHTSNCQYRHGHDCDCGLEELRASMDHK
jgi:hypothetical protein